jgi:dephospho-CoA kinase
MDAMTNPRTLALVGMPGSGKTVCASHLSNRGYFQFRFGSIVVDEVRRRNWRVNPENERIVREEIRLREGMDAIAKRALPLLKDALASHGTIVIDGLYSFSEYKMLQRELGRNMVVVAITAPRHIRYERLASRPVRPLTAQEAELRDWQEIEMIEKGGPIALADYTIVNKGSIDAMLAELDHLLDTLGMQP